MKKILLAVSTDLNTDQRMLRIANSLQQAGYQVKLVGRQKSDSQPLFKQTFKQVRLRTFIEKGFLFYSLFNLRLFFYILTQRMAIITAADLDVLPACWLAARLKRCRLVYDAHEIFTEVPELAQRPRVKGFWLWLEQKLIPQVDAAYTVNQSLANWYQAAYNIHFDVVKNLPVSQPIQLKAETGDYLLYQGALNAGRGLETLLEIVQYTNIPCVIVGDGDIKVALEKQVKELGISELVRFTGRLNRIEMMAHTQNCWLGFNLLEKSSLNYYYSLANKFFDYVQAGKPQLCMNFPEYASFQSQYEVAVLVDSLDSVQLSEQLLGLRKNKALYNQLAENCKQAAKKWIWEHEEANLWTIYGRL